MQLAVSFETDEDFTGPWLARLWVSTGMCLVAGTLPAFNSEGHWNSDFVSSIGEFMIGVSLCAPSSLQAVTVPASDEWCLYVP